MHNTSDHENAMKEAGLTTEYACLRGSDSSLESLSKKSGALEDRAIASLVDRGMKYSVAVRLVVMSKQVIYVAMGYIFYSICRIIAKVTTDKESAYNNADKIVNLEKDLGIFTEKEWQEMLVTCTFYSNNTVNDCEPVHDYSIDFMEQLNHFYSIAIWVVTSCFFLVAMNFWPRHYPLLGWWFCVTSSMAAVTFALFPCAPPRLVTKLHIVDALAEFSGIELYGPDPDAAVTTNPYAAFPSMHTGWSAICCLGTSYVCYKEKAKGTLGWVQTISVFILTVWYPLLTIFTIIVTGNHFWLDAIGGLLYVLVGWIIASKWLSNVGKMTKMEGIVYGEGVRDNFEEEGYENPNASQSGKEFVVQV